MRLCGSGSMIGSLHEPCTMKGSSKMGGKAVLLVDNKLAVPRRSSSRSGMDAEPLNPRPTAAPVIRTSSTLAMPSTILRFTVRVSYGVFPMRKSPRPESGLRSMRLSSCSTLKPAIAPFRLDRAAVPFKPLVNA